MTTNSGFLAGGRRDSARTLPAAAHDEPRSPDVDPAVSRASVATAVVPAQPYHRIVTLSPHADRWWRPLLVVLLTVALGVAGLAAVLALTIGISFVPGVPQPTETFDDPRNLTDMAVGLGMLAVLVPAVVLAVRWAGARRGALAGTLHSVAGRFRWALLLRAAVVVVPVFAVVNIGLFVLFPGPDASLPPFEPQLVAVYAAVLLLTPLQCAAEEYLFRGLPQQVLGPWLRSPVWGIVLPVPLFMAGHGYDAWGQVDIAVFALCMGFLTWKTGGLELPILVHVANNLTLFLVAPFSPSSLHQGETDPLVLLATVPLTLVVTAGLALWVSRREGLAFWQPLRGRGRRAEAPWRASGPRSGAIAAGPADSRWGRPPGLASERRDQADRPQPHTARQNG